MKKQKEKKKSRNREISLVTYIFTGIFILMLGNFAYFMFFQSKDVINSPYNKRQDLLAERIVRGKILGSNGEVLAETKINSDGKEYRNYPFDNVFVHVVGRFANGKSGVEQSENFNLLTASTNVIFNALNEIQGEKNMGDNVVTTLDVNLQKAAYKALGNHKGAIVAIEPDTGKILAMVAKPDYNPNQAEKNWDSLVEDEGDDSALLNRAAQGLYPPGSTFKVLMALEYIRENKGDKNYQYECKGKAIFSNVTISCYNNKKHGKVDLEQSIAHSCNTSFANIGTKIDMDQFRELCESFLFNKNLPLSIPYNKSSFVLNGSSDPSLIPQTAIGQGDTLITPIHNAMIAAAIANDGKIMSPYVVDRLENKNGGVVKKYMPRIDQEPMTAKEARALKKYMKSVVEEGGASQLKSLGFPVAGKTGSAEFNSLKESHSWFIGFAPADKPQIAVSVIVEGAGTGREYAVPIAKDIFEVYLKGK